MFNYGRLNKLKFPNDPIEYQFNIDDLEDQRETIGGTSRAYVQHYVHKPTRIHMAVKVIHIRKRKFTGELANNHHLESWAKEAELYNRLEFSPHVILCYGLCMDQERLLLCLELMHCTLNDLSNILHKNCGYFPSFLFQYIATCLVNGIAECFSRNILHRDIKPDNILVSKHGEIKLADFGESRILENNNQASTWVGTIAYWPPERLQSPTKYDDRSDTWSLGITLLELLCGKIPYNIALKREVHFMDIQQYLLNASKNQTNLLDDWIKNPEIVRLLRLDQLKYYNDVLFNNFTKLLILNMENRPRIIEVERFDNNTMSPQYCTRFITNLIIGSYPSMLNRIFDLVFRRNSDPASVPVFLRSFIPVDKYKIIWFTQRKVLDLIEKNKDMLILLYPLKIDILKENIDEEMICLLLKDSGYCSCLIEILEDPSKLKDFSKAKQEGWNLNAILDAYKKDPRLLELMGKYSDATDVVYYECHEIGLARLLKYFIENFDVDIEQIREWLLDGRDDSAANQAFDVIINSLESDDDYDDEQMD